MEPIIIAVEGNIGAGKTTALETLESMGYLVFYENIEKWRPLLESYYRDPKRWSFALQIAILADMAEQRRSAIIAVNDPANGGIERHPFVIFERSPASSMLFAKLSAEAGNMTEIEFLTYTQIYDEINWRADYSVYIDTAPMECLDRISQRKRPGEAGVTLEYLDAIERLHLTLLEPDRVLSGLQAAVGNAAQIVLFAMEKIQANVAPKQTT